MHPSQVLFGGASEPLVLPACDHYAGSEKLILRSLQMQADRGPVFDVTADCEDGAPVGREREHARMVAELVVGDANRFGRLGVRIHDPSHPSWRDDVETIVAVAGERLAYLTIPKVDGVEDLRRVADLCTAVEDRAGLSRRVPLQVLVETHGALRAAAALAAEPRVIALAFGVMDYVSAFGGAVPAAAMASPGQFEHPLLRRAQSEISVACHAAGRVPSHGVCTDIENPATVRDEARRASREFGFTRKWSIHPSQIDPIVEAMRPEVDEVELAAEVLLAAQRADWGPIRHHGRLHDRASYRYWWQLLRRAHAGGAALPDDARRAFFSEGNPR